MVRVARKGQEECLGKARNPAEGEAKKESSDGPCSERIVFPDIANEGDVRIGVLGPGGPARSAEKRGVEHPLLGTRATSGHLRLVLARYLGRSRPASEATLHMPLSLGRDDLEVVSRTQKR